MKKIRVRAIQRIWLIWFLFFNRLSLLNFIAKSYSSVFKILFQQFSPLWLRGDRNRPTPLDFTPFFEWFKLSRLCCVHVNKLTFFTTSRIFLLTFVALPLGDLESFIFKVTILSAVGALRWHNFIITRVDITLLVLF